MNTSVHILHELKAISPTVAAIPHMQVYTVPSNYFNQLHIELAANLVAENLLVLKELETVPAGYFESLPQQILQKIRAEKITEVSVETTAISTIVASISNKNVYTVPTSYFETFSVATTTSRPGKVLQMGFVTQFAKYAAAAIITGLVSIGIFNLISKPTANAVLGNVETAAVVQQANSIIAAGNFDEQLASLTDNDIEKYLKDNGENIQAGLVASASENAATLPDATDYLIDETTLDNFLDTHNLQQ